MSAVLCGKRKQTGTGLGWTHTRRKPERHKAEDQVGALVSPLKGKERLALPPPSFLPTLSLPTPSDSGI